MNSSLVVIFDHIDPRQRKVIQDVNFTKFLKFPRGNDVEIFNTQVLILYINILTMSTNNGYKTDNTLF